MNVRLAAAGIAVASLTLLQGCKPTGGECKASVDINQNNPSLKGECRWTFRGGRIATQIAMQEGFGDALGGLLVSFMDRMGVAQVQSFDPATFDASLLRMDTAGSTAAVEGTSGMFTVSLYRGTQLLSSNSFAWHRSGTRLMPADPGAINAWVGQYPQADGFEYGGTVRFDAGLAQSAAIYGTHTYNGSVSFSTTNAIARPRNGSGPGHTQPQ